MMDKTFLRLYKVSVNLKDAGMLRSALSKREEATQLMKRDETHYALGKANEALLLGEHIGDGLAAFAAAKEALKRLETFHAASKEWEKLTGTNVFHDLLAIVGRWPASRDEDAELNKLCVQWNVAGEAKPDPKATENSLRQEPHWWETQLSIACRYYNRECPETDMGGYAQAMSILQCILSRTFAKKAGYDPDYDSYVRLLDDYLMISTFHFHNVLKKYRGKADLHKMSYRMEELSVILESPVKIWTAFAPLLRTKNKALSKLLFTDYWLIFSLANKENLMELIIPHLPDAMISCPLCGRQIANHSLTCRYCGKETGLEAIPPESQEGYALPGIQLKNMGNELHSSPSGKKSLAGCTRSVLLVTLGMLGLLLYIIIRGNHAWYILFFMIIAALAAALLFSFLKHLKK
jgi:hypothetical protein